jgi:hypothetical protein
LKHRSNNNIVIAPANTGRDNNKRKTVTNRDQINNLIKLNVILKLFMFKIVDKKLIAPRIDLRPAIWSLKIIKFTLEPVCPIELKGGYNVHLVPLPKSIKQEIIINIKDIGNNQNDKLLSRGNLMSGHPNNKGNIQLPNPPIILGITIKKIIINA